MSTQLKNSEPAGSEKPSRRGAAGRAAALRRAPSDSDCSGETASLSADSGERRPPPPPPRGKSRNKEHRRFRPRGRPGSKYSTLPSAVFIEVSADSGERRPPPPPPRRGSPGSEYSSLPSAVFIEVSADSGERRPPPPPPRGKSRNRRRGSEWEVLEGLKDGQRFERRPEVFNGFLHKKRKWPLKGWHKRFFVVDGGILVYARSPTDVARGRLHGSLDVGLSVISAKPRRRRIDIDADEFIYHLRAKTPDVFRTWLNVLKAHRLYRQHLLTFGARESVPKIHAPLDDLPPTDSSRVSLSSVESFSSLTLSKTDPKDYFTLPLSEFNSSLYYMKSKSTWMTDDSRPSEQSDPSSSKTTKAPVSLCSTHCIEKRQGTKHDSYKKLPVIPLDEQQIHCTDLDLNTLNSSSVDAETTYRNPDSISSTKNNSFNTNSFRSADLRESKSHRKMSKLHHSPIACEQSPIWPSKRDQAALFCFSRKQKSGSKSSEEWDMKKSRKCTNLVKYKNVGEEPCLKKPLLKKMLLNKYKHNVFARLEEKIVCPMKTVRSIRDKATQDSISPSECDVISERLIFNLFDKTNNDKDKKSSVYVNCVVKELYDLKFTDSDRHPIKVLFKCLLQYYLKNTKGTFKGSVKRDIGSVTPRHHTSDKEIQTKETLLSRSNAQNLESVLKSTIYGCSVVPGKSRENDIEITKMLRDNLDKLSKSDHNNTADSSELSQLQEYIKHIMSEASIPKSVAKDFLNVYLDILGHCSPSDTSVVSSEFSRESNVNNPVCDIQAESVRKKISRSISCPKKPSIDGNINQSITKNLNQLNLKDMVDKMIGLFTCDNEETRPSKVPGNIIANKAPEINQYAFRNAFMRDNTVVMDLSKYEFHNILWSKNATELGTSSITINLKDRTAKSDEAKLKNLSLQFTNDISKEIRESDVTYTIYNPNKSNDVSPKNEENSQVPSISSEATSKGNLPEESDLYVNMLNDNSKLSKKVPFPKCSQNTQCYLVSSIINDVPLMEDRIKSLKKLQELTPASYSSKSRIIDEELIFRVLESLVAISKDIVGINEEISNLHLNLKKRYANSIKHFPGIDFLGSIYGKVYNNEATDLDFYTGNHEEAIEVAVNTSFVFPNYERKDQALSAIGFSKTLPDIEDKDNDVTKTKSPNAYQCPELKNDEKEEWLKGITQKYIESTAIKCMLKKYHNLPQSIRVAHPIKAKIAEKLGVPQNSSMMVEFSTSSPPLSNSIGSQMIKESNMEMRLKVNRSESATGLSVNNVHNDVSDELKTIYRCSSEPSYCSGLISPNAVPIRGPQAGFVSGTPGGRLAGWIVESGGPLESASRELGQAQLSVQQLQRLLDAMLELQHNLHHDTDVSVDGASPNVKNYRRKFGLRKKKSNSKCASVELAPPNVDASISHMALSALTAPPSPGGGSSSVPNSAASLPIAFLSTFLASTLVPCVAARPQSLPGAEALGVNAGGPTSLTSLTPDHQLREDFTILAKDLVTNLKTVVSTLVVERGRLQAAMAGTEPPAAGGVVAALRTNLTSALQQNSELRSRLSRIHDASDLAEISSVGNNSDQSTLQQVTRPFPQSLSYSSSCVSASEFFDAEEHEELKPTEIIATDEAGVIELDGDSSSEAGSLSSEEGEGSASSDNSDGATSAVIPAERTPIQNGGQICMRRSRLPCPRPTPASPSLWNLLYKNIGKDLSQISMPVTINEPLNMLQRLCEELEYSSLLDSASSCTNEVERMSLVAAFAVSAYAASAHRAASKPFNPLLAETYEYVCGDRGFRFIAEQVSHHPPISACHAESPRWIFWQEARIKTKFWGKSMEFQPTGRVHVRLTPSGDHYSWNKVTTCVHNLFGGQRWVDQYGDMHITCHGTDINCKLQFIKASSWSSSRHEVRGVVAVGGGTRLRLQGRWSEGLQAGDRTLWRPGAMPADYELYYGFTRFAMELNELEPGMRHVLPSTDTRFRPDQRALEEGDVDAAEQFKLEVEQAQRERRRDGVEYSPQWFRKTMEDGEETWVFTGEYWKVREAGFDRAPRLW